MKSNPFKDRNLSIRLKWPVLSWSSYNAFVNYSKEDWYQSYVLGIPQTPNPAMIAGQIIGERLATDPTYLPQVPRPEEYEPELKAVLDTIPLIGHLDGLSLKKFKGLEEYKTSMSDATWTGASVAKWRQIDFYLLLVWLSYKIRPEDMKVRLTYIPVVMTGSFEVIRSDEPIRIIHTTRNMSHILRFAIELRRVYKEMQEFIHRRQLTP